MPANPISTFFPLPGHTLRPGLPAPADARLSLGLAEPSTPTRHQPTTTIRLVSNPVSDVDSYHRTPQLQPFKTNFDLVFGSPQPSGGFHGTSLWPSGEGQQKKGIYPPLPLDDLVSFSKEDPDPVSSSTKPALNDMDVDASTPTFLASPKHAVPSLLSPTPKSTTITQLAVTDHPFIFGSPLPQHNVTNSQFKSAATSVLEEMNKRLKQDGIDGVGMDLITKLHPGAHAVGVGTLPPREKEPPKTTIYKDKFDKLHEEEFSKMEGIDSLVRRRALLAPKECARPVVKSRSSASGAAGRGVGRDRFGRRIGGENGRLSAATMVNESRQRRRSRVVPGAFGDEDEEEDEAGKEDAKPPESTKEEDKKGGVETKVEEDEEKVKAEEEERKQKEREAIKKKLEMNKARRKSSVAGAKGRVSVGRGGVLVKPQPVPQQKPSRFGFFSSAKSLVAKVWGGGKAASSGTPKPATTKGPKAASAPTPAPVPTYAPAPKKALVSARSSTVTNLTRARVSSLRGEKDKATTIMSSVTSSLCSRPPLPSMTPAPTPSTTTKSSITKPETGTSSQGISTLGTRSSFVSTSRSSSSGTVGSMGSKRMLGSHSSNAASATATVNPGSSRLPSFRLSSSRLLAPTASSLAKATANKSSVSGLKPSLRSTAEGSSAQIQKAQSSASETLNMITNSPRKPGEPWSPRPKRIFSKPLVMNSRIPTPTKKPPPTTSPETSKEVDTAMMGLAPNRQRSLSGRKPRISRSKVIARLASQRAASASRPGLSRTPGAKAGRTRSSLGVKAQRSSYSGKSMSVKGPEESVLMSAKKRVRQGEYARRKSHVASIDLGKEMDVDGE
ncbi:hypothetical protein C0989_010361 [Termitomyces sp. Mn162]|nr:hypothetical protein C0989_010361 [Termitomyces sp. Mn162]